MRVLDHDELTPSLETDLQLLRLEVGWIPRDFRRIQRAVSLGYPAPDYFGVYAVEDGRVLSTVRVVRLPYTFPDGRVETVAGILSVITRRDARGRGLATRLLELVNSRERKAGVGFSLLWTDMSISAHPLYERIGYRDIYAPEVALRRLPDNVASKSDYEFSTAKEGDVPAIERLHGDLTRKRIGFTPRPGGYVSSQIALGTFRPESVRFILKGGRRIGYAVIDEGPNRVKVPEVVVPDRVAQDGGLAKAFERLSAGKWLEFWNTFVRDSRPVLEGRGYAFSSLGDHLLMSLPLGKAGRGDQTKVLGTHDPRFTCQLLDYF